MQHRSLSLAVLLVLSSCATQQAANPPAETACPPCAEVAAAPAPAAAPAEVTAAEPAPATGPTPADGAVTFTTYEGFLSPAQEPGEESETPKALQRSLGGTAPATDRKQRKSRGYGRLRIARDLSRAYVDVQLEGVRAEDIVMFHIHCGPPGVLGPIIVDFGDNRDLVKELADGALSVELTDENITYVKGMPKGLKPSLPEGCPIELGLVGQVKTIAGFDALARKGVLYFNLHTRAHTYYGEMRGQIYAAEPR